MTDIFREVDEALRRDRVAKFWQENAAYVIAFVLGTIILTAGFSGYKAWDAGTKQKQSAALIALQGAPEYPDNITAAALGGMRPALRGIALLGAAGKQAGKKKPAEALKLYEAAAADTKIPQDLRDLATLMSVRILSDDKAADGPKLIARLEPLWMNPKGAWAGHARLEAAVVTASAMKDPAAARAYLNDVQDMTGQPETLYAKARALDHIYALRAEKTPAAKTQTAPTATDSKS